MKKILYKRSLEGQLIWIAELKGKAVHISYGQKGGNLMSTVHECKSEYKARVEFYRRVDKKIDREGYTDSPQDKIPEMPMLASQYNGHSLPETVAIQPKLDGIRCIGSNEGLHSRRRTPITSLFFIEQVLKDLPDGIVLDGELYAHGESWETQLSLIKRDEFHPRAFNLVRYHVFDLVDYDMPFLDRYKKLTELFESLPLAHCTLVDTTLVRGFHLSRFKHLKNMEKQGYEGVIIRHPSGLYKANSRSSDLQKLKSVHDEEFQIVDIVSSKTGREEGCAIYVLETDQGRQFRARPADDINRRSTIYKNRRAFIGYWTKVKFFGKSDLGIPRTPRAYGLAKTREELQ